LRAGDSACRGVLRAFSLRQIVAGDFTLLLIIGNILSCCHFVRIPVRTHLQLNLKLALAYALAGVVMLQFAIPPGYVTPLFPSAGIALFAVWRYGLRSLPGVFAGALAVHAAACCAAI
jgi:hypothetical protein